MFSFLQSLTAEAIPVWLSSYPLPAGNMDAVSGVVVSLSRQVRASAL